MSLKIGFRWTKQVKYGLAQSLLCKMDLQIADQGLTSLHYCWKTEEHQLRGKRTDCGTKNVFWTKDVRGRPKRRVSSRRLWLSAFLQFTYSWLCRQGSAVAGRQKWNREIEEGREIHLLTQLQVVKLRCCQFVESMVLQCEFVSADRNLEILTSILLLKRQLEALELANPAFQANEWFC